jgi:hypothetical protein
MQIHCYHHFDKEIFEMCSHDPGPAATLPTFRKLLPWHGIGTAQPISFSCWSLWIGANASTALTAGERLGDAGLALISVFNAACCGAVLLLAFYKRACARFGEPEHGAGKPVPV